MISKLYCLFLNVSIVQIEDPRSGAESEMGAKDIQVVVNGVEWSSETETSVDQHLDGEQWLVLDVGGKSAVN